MVFTNLDLALDFPHGRTRPERSAELLGHQQRQWKAPCESLSPPSSMHTSDSRTTRDS